MDLSTAEALQKGGIWYSQPPTLNLVRIVDIPDQNNWSGWEKGVKKKYPLVRRIFYQVQDETY